MILLYRSRNNTGNADAVAAHHHRLTAALLVLHGGIHGFRVLGAQLKNMAYLDAAPNFQGSLSTRAGVSADNFSDVGELSIGDIARPGSTLDMESVLVGAADESWAFVLRCDPQPPLPARQLVPVSQTLPPTVV